jgi:prepilin-type N-terminal cleavage/methylation domain-containing protein
MKATLPSSRLPKAYTLIEVLAAMSIIALAIGAASQLSLSQAVTEETNQKQTIAVNYAENNVRLWQLGVTPSSFLLISRNFDNSAMSCTFSAVSTTTGALDNSTNAVQVDRCTVTAYWSPPSTDAVATLSFPALRLKADRR